MAPEPETVSEWEQQLDEAILSYEKARDAGQMPDPREVLARYPDLADDLASYFANQGVLDPLLAPLRDATLAAPPASVVGQHIGDYQVLEEITHGGMGVVYRAWQITPNRIVALKMIRSGELANAEEVRRFLAEAEAAASLDHPNIVPIYEVGQHRGQPFFSMKLIEGNNLNRDIPVVTYFRCTAG